MKAVRVCLGARPRRKNQEHQGVSPQISAGIGRAEQVWTDPGDERGAEILEFAFVFSMLAALMLAIVSFARAYNIYQTVTRAAREGAREAVLPSAMSAGNSLIDTPAACTSPATATNTPQTTIFTNYVKPALLASSLNPGNVTNYEECAQFLDPGDADQQCGLVVNFQYPYPLEIPFLGTGLGTIDFSTNVQMRLENQDGACPP